MLIPTPLREAVVNAILTKTKPDIPKNYSCPSCGATAPLHDNSVCDMRYFHDEVNEKFGWISKELVQLIPGEMSDEEKLVKAYQDRWDNPGIQLDEGKDDKEEEAA
jgi:hypothetical protein